MSNMKKIYPFLIIFAVITLAIFSQSFFDNGTYQAYAFHSDQEITYFKAGGKDLPTGINSIFAASGECALCHGTAGAGPNTTALQDANGNDVSPVNDWRATMMANSAKDPMWRAKVSHEILVNPSLQTEIENTCIKCHAPNGFFNAIHNGQPHYTIAEMKQDSMALDGVTCTTCHSMLPDNLGSVFSAGMSYDTTKTIYGPYPNPLQMPMQNNIGFTPVQGDHIRSSEMCGACHTLITPSVDLAGIPTGVNFVEQAIYHEWLNSEYSSTNQTSCQDCHVPRITENVVIADRPPWLGARDTFGRHELVGGNAFMLNILKNNIDTLGLSANETQFDTVINRTVNQLMNKTLDASLTEINRTIDTAFYDLELLNKIGHKFPGGYPSRRAFVTFVVTKTNGDTLFHSGKADSQYRLLDEDATFEPHYNTINDDTQVQIYEMVMGDVNGNVTTVLLRANSHLKDNRLAPKGFTTSHNAYDTVSIVGNAFADTDFNKQGAMEGTGIDVVHYNIPLNGYTGDLNVKAKVYYQPLPPKFTDAVFAHNSTEIDLMEGLYNNAEHTPVIVAEASLGIVGINKIKHQNILIYPNPTLDYVKINLTKSQIKDVYLFDNNGKLIENKSNQNIINLPAAKGIYFLKIVDDNNLSILKKIIKK
jgi:hypothetical protein